MRGAEKDMIGGAEAYRISYGLVSRAFSLRPRSFEWFCIYIVIYEHIIETKFPSYSEAVEIST